MKKFFGFKYFCTEIVLLLFSIMILLISIFEFGMEDLSLSLLWYGILTIFLCFEIIYLLHSIQWVILNENDIIFRSALGLNKKIDYKDIKKITVKDLLTFSSSVGYTKYEKWILIIVDDNIKPRDILNTKKPPYVIPYSEDMEKLLQSRIALEDYKKRK